MAACGPDILSLCHSVDLEEGVRRAGASFAYQGNIDSGVLFGSREAISRRVHETAQQAQRAGVRHILNLGHGIMQVGDASAPALASARDWDGACTRGDGGRETSARLGGKDLGASRLTCTSRAGPVAQSGRS